jgi:hypothetical protein
MSLETDLTSYTSSFAVLAWHKLADTVGSSTAADSMNPPNPYNYTPWPAGLANGTVTSGVTFGTASICPHATGTCATFAGTGGISLANPSKLQIANGYLWTGFIAAYFKTSSPGSGLRFIAGKPTGPNLVLNNSVLGFYSGGTFKSTGLNVADGAKHSAQLWWMNGSIALVYADGTQRLPGGGAASPNDPPITVASIFDFGTIDNASNWGIGYDTSTVGREFAGNIQHVMIGASCSENTGTWPVRDFARFLNDAA